MAQMNPGIILAGQPVNVLGAMQAGNDLAAQTMAMRDQQAMRNLFATHGPGIFAGDPTALNALAGINPMTALGVQSTQQGMRAREQEIATARENARLRAMEMTANMDAATKEAEAQKLDKALAGATQITDERTWDRYMRETGIPDLVGRFGDRDIVVAGALGLKDALAMSAPAEPFTDEGKRTADIRSGYIDPSAPAPVDMQEVDKFRKEFSGLPAVKAFSEQAQAFGRIVASAKDPSPAGDLAMIFNFMKVLDPGSVVRESEFATAAQASAWLQRSEEMGVEVPRPIASAIRAISTGQRLSPEQRADFVGRAASLYENAEGVYGNVEAQFKAIAGARGYPMDQSVIDYRYTGERSAAPVGSPPQAPPPVSPQYQLDPATDARLRELLAPAR